MEHLEVLSRSLESMRFSGPNLQSPVPCPPSVMRYLNYRQSANDPSIVVDPLSSTPSLSLENDELPNQKKNVKIGETPKIRTRNRKERRNRQNMRTIHGIKSPITSEKNQSIPELSNVSKNFFPDYLPLEEVKKGLESGELFEATIRISNKCNSEAYVPSPDKTKDILIYTNRSRNRALEGDKVVVKVLDRTEWRNPGTEECQRTGVVVYITERKENRVVVGHLLVERGPNHRFSSLIPRDTRLPKLIVNTSNWPVPIELKPGTKESKELFYAILPCWDNFKFPLGELKGVLGESGDINTETKGILCTHEIEENPYPSNIDKYFPPPFSVEEELKHRKDFRKHCIFSIDPPTAKDLDDALSCILLENGNYEIGIHISDVSHFVKHNTPLDAIAEKLATSVYLVQKVYHMLPPTLTMMASLLPSTDKLAVSITLEMTPYADVVSHSFSRSIIHSCAQLHYPHAQIFLQNPEKKNWDESEFPRVYNGYTINDCATAVCHLHKLASIMRKRRFDNGALAINQPKLSFEIDRATCEPLSYSLYILHESNWLIEEFMLLANTLVAEHLKSHFPTTAMLRNHQPPEYSPMDKAVKLLKNHGINIDFTSAGSIHKSKIHFSQNSNSDKNHWDIVINNILSKPMVRAEYCVISPDKNMNHFALNVPYYTHFTSPIRRYPDIVVHRQLISWLTGSPIKQYEDPEVIDKIAQNSNDKKNNAKKASEASAEIYAAHLIGKLGGIVEYASVMEVKENYFEATVLSMNINVKVFVSFNYQNTGLEHENSLYDIIDNKPTLTIIWDSENNNKQLVQTFAKVKLKLTKKEDSLRIRAVLIQDNNI